MSAVDPSEIRELSQDLLHMSFAVLRFLLRPGEPGAFSMQQLRETLAAQLMAGELSEAALVDACSRAPQADPTPAPRRDTDTNAAIDRYHVKAALVRLLFDHASAGGHWRAEHTLVWSTREAVWPWPLPRGSMPAFRSALAEYHGAMQTRNAAVLDAIAECLSEGLIQLVRPKGLRVSDTGRAWLARCDREWLEERAT